MYICILYAHFFMDRTFRMKLLNMRRYNYINKKLTLQGFFLAIAVSFPVRFSFY